MANIALELNQNGGVEQLIPFSVKLSDFVLVEPDPVNNPGVGEYRVPILPSVGSKYFIDKVVITTDADLIYVNGSKYMSTRCPSNSVSLQMEGVLAGESKMGIASDPVGTGFQLLDGELFLKNGDTFGNASITSLVDATLSGYIKIIKES